MKIKFKTKKSILKRIKVKKNQLYHKKAGKCHFMRRKNSKKIRILSQIILFNKSNLKNLKKLIYL